MSILTAGYEAAVMVVLTNIAIAILLTTYDDRKSMGKMLAVGMLLVLAAWAWHYALLLLPVFYIFTITPLESFSFRNAIAMLLGVLCPLWIALPAVIYCLWQGLYTDLMMQKYAELQEVTPLMDYKNIDAVMAVVYVVLVFLFIILIFRRPQNGYHGKKYARMQFTVYSFLVLIMMVAIPMLPTLATHTLPLMVTFVGAIAAQRAMRDDRRA